MPQIMKNEIMTNCSNGHQGEMVKTSGQPIGVLMAGKLGESDQVTISLLKRVSTINALKGTFFFILFSFIYNLYFE